MNSKYGSKGHVSFVAALCLVLFLGGYLFTSVLLAQAERKGTLFTVDGVVDFQKGGSTQWVPAEKGMEVLPGDKLRTSLDSTVDIVLDDGSTLRLDEESEMVLESLSEDKEKARFMYFFNRPVEAKKTKLKLNEGKVLANVKPLANSQSTFHVETPKGVAGVRGTSWFIGTDNVGVRDGFIIYAPKGVTIFDVLARIAALLKGPQEGRDTELGGNTQAVNEGQQASVSDNGALTDFRVLSNDQLQELTRVLEKAIEAGNLTEIPDTHSQAGSNDYIYQQIVGDAGGSGGAIGTGKGSLGDSTKDQEKDEQIDPNQPQDQTTGCPT